MLCNRIKYFLCFHHNMVMSNIKKLLGQRIKELRKSKKITQEELAEKIGIGTSNISYIENGKYAPSIENFEKIAEVLEVEPCELYKFAHHKTTSEIKSELFTALENDEKLLKLMYKIYLGLK